MKLLQKPKSISVGSLTKYVGGAPSWKWLIHSIADHQLYLTGLAAPFLLFASYLPWWLQIIGWSLLGLPWICRLAVDRRLTHPTLIDPLFLGLFVMVPVGLIASIDRSASFSYVSQVAVGAGLFYGLVNVRLTRLSLWLPVAGLFVMAAGLALAAPFIVTWSSSRFFFEQAYNRLTPIVSESLDANILAAILSMTLLLLIALIWRGRFSKPPSDFERLLRRPKVLMVLAGLIMFLAQAFTQSRGAAAGLVIGLFTLGVFFKRRLLLMSLPLLALAGYAVARLTNLGTVGNLLLSAGPGQGWSSRQEVWSSAIYMLRAMPFTGIGMGTFVDIQSLLFPFSQGWEPTHAHNLFLQVGVDLGIPGLVAYVAIVTSCLVMAFQAWRAFRRTGEQNLEALSAGVFAALIAMITHGLVDAPLWGTKPSVVAWYFMGLAAMLFVHSRESTAEPTRPEIGTPS